MDDRISKLEVLIGTWETTITLLGADGSEGAASKATDIYRWSPNNKFVLHDVDAEMPGQHVQSMEIIALDPNSAGYNTRSYEPDGTFADYHADLVGRSWNITGETLRFRGEFSGDGKVLSGQWDQKSKGSWQAIMHVSLRKRA